MKKRVSIENAPKHYGAIVDRLKVHTRPADDSAGMQAEPADVNFLIASAEENDGRTTTAIGLAVAAAVAKPNRQILLVDLDQRSPSLESELSLKKTSAAHTLGDVLHRGASIDSATRPTSLPNLRVICGDAGLDLPDDLQSDAMRRFLQEVQSTCDYAFYDSPAMLPHVDAQLLSNLMDRVVLVIRQDRTKKDDVVLATRQLPQAKIAGAVMNDARQPIPSFLARHL